MGSLGIFGLSRDLQEYKYYDLRTTSVTASTIADDLDAFPKAQLILLLSGKDLQTEKKTLFGYYVPLLEIRHAPFLFQLSDTSDSFRGNGPRPGHELDGGELIIGQRGNGAALMLRQDAKRAIVSHNVSDQFEPIGMMAADYEEETTTCSQQNVTCIRSFNFLVPFLVYYYWIPTDCYI
ncbi:hypothetical protein AO1008_11665 [Aspergillus oryzae 100-8]|uniref:Uncharacterized protein n=1 Tax=Aspergillus oryzae (strain 3.042) TaxID=1160506 RepID=I8A5Y2_ASPO3|nr:hypothetical protein Ao3042_03531 [Aspergillus oryzae 3.042]KDE75337.1 hypothetical protein AO1008_11665 [Aspergillus oryzae 100-8]|eukprot:EIT80044.1 hypothetical protein Ao3042_03531 [Aspergillus oryzae 3.042]